MRNANSFSIYVWACIAVSILVQVFKYIDIQKFKQVYKKRMIFKWFTMHSSAEIYGTSSNDRRLFMIKSNKLTTAFWFFIAVAGVLAVVQWVFKL